MNPSGRRAWQGVYYDGRSAVRRSVTVLVLDRGLRLVEGEETVRWWPYGEVRRMGGDPGGEPLRFERGADPPETLVVDDPAMAALVAHYAPALGRRTLLSRWPLLWLTVAAAGGAALLVVTLYFWGIPGFADALAAKVPLSWEERLGEAVVAQITAQTLPCTGAAGEEALTQIVRRLADASPSRYTYRVSVAQVGMVNAFAAPGGYVVIFHGLLERMETPDELAGVIAHEMQHVIQRHGTRNLIRALSLRALIAMISGDAGGLGRVLELGGSLASLSYSRADEAAADRDGMRMLQAARVNPQGLIDFFVKIQKEEGDLPAPLTYLSNHPSTADRLAALRRQAAENRYTPVPLLDQASWQALKRICAP